MARKGLILGVEVGHMESEASPSIIHGPLILYFYYLHDFFFLNWQLKVAEGNWSPCSFCLTGLTFDFIYASNFLFSRYLLPYTLFQEMSWHWNQTLPLAVQLWFLLTVLSPSQSRSNFCVWSCSLFSLFTKCFLFSFLFDRRSLMDMEFDPLISPVN